MFTNNENKDLDDFVQYSSLWYAMFVYNFEMFVLKQVIVFNRRHVCIENICSQDELGLLMENKTLVKSLDFN